MELRSTITGLDWPAVLSAAGAAQLAVLDQLDRTQHLDPGDLERLQLCALTELLGHAVATVPFYRDRPVYAEVLSRAGEHGLSAEDWAGLPRLSRADIVAAGPQLHSDDPPGDHLPTSVTTTSGSTGRPVTALASAVTRFFWRVITVRDHLWHQRDLGGHLAAIRTDRSGSIPPEGTTSQSWGPATAALTTTGPASVLSVGRDVANQAGWLLERDPDYLLSLPSNLAALAGHLGARARRLGQLRQVRTYGEVLTPEVRRVIEDGFGVPVVDMYSSEEVGYMALQCPASPTYHAQAEVVRIEVLDGQDRPCPPGETGAVVVTPLHNYTMPLIRYEIGDFTEVGGECGCGRALPVLARIAGRRRNMLVVPDGRTIWPTFGQAWRDVAAVRQFQLVQTHPDRILARIVSDLPLTGTDEAAFTAALRARFGYPFTVDFEYVPEIARGAGMKYEDFVSHVSSPTISA